MIGAFGTHGEEHEYLMGVCGRTRLRCGVIIKTVLTEIEGERGTESMWLRIVVNEDGNEPSISVKHG
jgi:hypothetical protein